jgi:hypothetical protein
VIYTKLAILLIPILTTTTTLITPQDRGFSVGTGEKQIPPYLEATYVPTEEKVPVSPKTALYEVFGKDAEIMWQIALAESGGRQFNGKGQVIIGGVTPDIGLLQISPQHLPEANKLNIDVYTLIGNLEFAKLLFDRPGTTPWNSSKHNWSKVEF